MLLSWEVHILSLALYFFDSCSAIDRSLQKMSEEIETRNLKNEDGSLVLTSDVVELLKKIANHASDNSRLLLARSETLSHIPNPFDWLDMIVGMAITVISKRFHKPNASCYDGFGCFYESENMSLPHGGPMPPEKMGTVFYFFNNMSRTEPQNSTNFTLANWTLDAMKEPDKPLVIITHGFTGDITTPWMFPLIDAFLMNVNCNVIAVDWRDGAQGPNYLTAAANTPMVGVQISLLLQMIINATNCTLHPDNITLTGFSLGAHVMGFAGRHFFYQTDMKLRRITGLDPAGALFENTDAALSRNDAKYVDIIHTNGGDIKTFKLGLGKARGHVDFYPNGGSLQPNCSYYPNVSLSSLQNTTAAGVLMKIMESVACSHYRAPELLTESLTNHTCNFTSYPCPGGWKNFSWCYEEFKDNETVKGLMGYYSFKKFGRGRQYLKTNNATPYCIPETKQTVVSTSNFP